MNPSPSKYVSGSHPTSGPNGIGIQRTGGGVKRRPRTARGAAAAFEINYWADVSAGKVFCVVEAPNAEAAHTVHREAHGLVADEIFPVEQG